MKAVIIYNTKTGTTRKYALSIGEYLEENGMDVTVSSVGEYSPEMTEGADYLLLGSWTRGIFFFLQHPGRDWVEFTRELPAGMTSRILLFTTYKVRTGSMFKAMYAHLGENLNYEFIELKSRNGSLSIADRAALDRLIEQAA